MEGSERGWLLRLRAAAAGREPVCRPATLAMAEAAVGPGPVGWGLEVALDVIDEIIRQVPAYGAAPREKLHRSAEASVLLALAGLRGNVRPDPGLVPAEAIEANAELVHRGMPLDQVLRGVRIGHAWLHHALMTALDAVPEAVRGQEAHRVGGLLFAYADTHASRMAEEYVAERDRWQGSTEVARRRIVADLLAGRRIDTEEAAGTLGYHLSGHHLAFIIWARDLSAPAEAIYRFATRLVSAAGCDGWLAVPAVLSELWVWASWAARPPPGIVTDLRGLVTPPAGIQVTAGPVASGPQGVRRSHLGAQEASRVARMGDAGSWLCDYAQVRAVSLLTADLEHARWYVREVLGALSGADDRIRELRETLREYLVSGRSLPGAGERLQLARNTVGYRVRRAEEILGRPLDEDGWEIRLALEIAAVLPAGPAEQGG